MDGFNFNIQFPNLPGCGNYGDNWNYNVNTDSSLPFNLNVQLALLRANRLPGLLTPPELSFNFNNGHVLNHSFHLNPRTFPINTPFGQQQLVSSHPSTGDGLLVLPTPTLNCVAGVMSYQKSGSGGRGRGWGNNGNWGQQGAAGSSWQQGNNSGGNFGGNYDGDDSGFGGNSRQGYRAVDRYGGQRGERGGGRGGWRRDRERRDTHRVDLPPKEDMSEDGSGQGRGERERPPPGLKGREIGMWYAKRSQARKERELKNSRPTVMMDRARENKIRALLDNLQESDPSTCSSTQASASGGLKRDSPSSCPDMDKLTGPVKRECLNVAETPDSWEDIEDGKPFEVQVVPPSSSGSGADQQMATASSMDTEEMDCDEDGNPVPSVAGVVQYMRAHGDYPYVDEEPDTDFISAVPESDNPELDKKMSDTMLEQQSMPQFMRMMDFRKKLPSYQMRETIVQAVSSNQALVISGETGCGKTTQVPQFILDDYITRGVGSQCRIICTQPRRISAISVAERVAAERCDKVNDSCTSSVGYQIRLETKRPRSQGSILFCTTGIVLKFLENDPSLQRATHVIIDEIHERDLQSDFLMIILKDLLPCRPDLKVILMSATLNAEMFSQYFNNCPMLNIPGFTYPVTEYLLEDIIQMLGYRPQLQFRGRGVRRKRSPDDIEEEDNYRVWCNNLMGRYSPATIDALRNMEFTEIDLELIHQIIHHICTKMEEGAILVFLPGWEEIKKLNEMIQKTVQSRSGSLRVIPLHSLMPTVNQREVFDRPPPGIRKIVIATNIAETSITIDDVVFVIDCGKIKVKDFKPEVNLTSLEPKWVSKANAKQRRGRAGRVQPGHCFHLYTDFRYSLCEDYLKPEMLRTRLEELCLQIKLLKLGHIVPFISKAMEHPSMESITHAINTLMELNALDHEENLLPLGYHLARMPVEPHTGKMILFGAMFCCLDPILTVAASLSFKDAFTVPLGKEVQADRARRNLAKGSKSDHIMLINAFKGWETAMKNGDSGSYCWSNFLSESTLRMLRDMKRQLAELLYDIGFVASRDPKDPRSNVHSDNLALIRAVLCAGLYPNVAMVTKVPKPSVKRHTKIGMITKDNSRVAAHPKSVNMTETFFESKWMVYYHMLKTSKVYIHDCTMVSPYPLLFFGGEIKIQRENNTELVSVDDWVVFKASASTAQLVKDLRAQLDKLLTQKIRHPGPTIWNPDTTEGALMAAILDLITTEEKQIGFGHSKLLEGSIGVRPQSSRSQH